MSEATATPAAAPEVVPKVPVESTPSAAPAPAEKAPETAGKLPESAESAGDQPESEEKSTPETPKKSAAGRISQLYAEKKAAEARAAAHLQELERLRSQIAQDRQTPIDQLPYEQQEAARFRQMMREDRLEQTQAEAQRYEAEIAQKRAETFRAQVESAKDRMPDFDQVFTSDLPITQVGADLIAESERGAEIAYYLGKNRSEAARIATLPPHLQGAEIARIEAKLARAPAARKVSQAPTPPPVISGATSATLKDPADMTMDEYAEWRRKGGG